MKAVAPILILSIGLAVPALAGAAAADALRRADAVVQFHDSRLKSDSHSFLDARALGAAFAGLGRLTGSLADYKSAEHAFRVSLSIQDAGNTPAVIGLANALQSQHRFHEAKCEIESALPEALSHPSILAVAGDIAFELGDYARADSMYSYYANLKPSRESASRLAKLDLLYGHWEEARARWEQICLFPAGEDPEPVAWAWVMHGDVYLRAGRLPEARGCFAHALEVMPGYFLALEHVAETFELEGMDDDAARLLDSGCALTAHPDLLLRRANLHARQGDKQSAKVCRYSAFALLELELASGDAGHRRVLIDALLTHGMDSKRALSLARAEREERGDIGAEMILARALAANGEIIEAVKHAERALRFGSYEPGFYREAALIFDAAGQNLRAHECRARIRVLNPIMALQN